MVWPQSRVSVSAIAGTCLVMSSPSLRMILARSAAGVAAHFGKAALAAATAWLTSCKPPDDTSAKTSCVAGSRVSKVSALATERPSIKWSMRIFYSCLTLMAGACFFAQKLISQGVDQIANTFNAGHNHIAHLTIHHAIRCTCQNQIARL